MSVFDSLRSFEFDRNKNHLFGLKSAVIWGHSKLQGSYPILYISKPKNITQTEYEELLDCIDIQFKSKRE